MTDILVCSAIVCKPKQANLRCFNEVSLPFRYKLALCSGSDSVLVEHADFRLLGAQPSVLFL